MIVASHGIIGSSIGQFDPDAVAFFARVTAAGGTLSATEQTAVNTLVLKMKFDGIWNSMKAIYPMVGASAAACAQNLKSSSFTGTFTATGWTFASTGVTPNGTSAYMDTNFLPSTQMTNNNTHISYYSRTITNTGGSMIGTSKGVSALPILSIYTKTTTQFFSDAYSYVDNRITVTPTQTSSAFFLNTRTSATSFKFFRNNLQFGTTNTNTSSQNITTCDKNIFLNAMNLDGVAGQFAPNQCAFASIGDGLTDTQAGLFYTTVQAFQTTLSRQV